MIVLYQWYIHILDILLATSTEVPRKFPAGPQRDSWHWFSPAITYLSCFQRTEQPNKHKETKTPAQVHRVNLQRQATYLNEAGFIICITGGASFRRFLPLGSRFELIRQLQAETATAIYHHFLRRAMSTTVKFTGAKLAVADWAPAPLPLSLSLAIGCNIGNTPLCLPVNPPPGGGIPARLWSQPCLPAFIAQA